MPKGQEDTPMTWLVTIPNLMQYIKFRLAEALGAY